MPIGGKENKDSTVYLPKNVLQMVNPKHERSRLTISPNTEKKIENTKRSEVFLTTSEVFENVSNTVLSV